MPSSENEIVWPVGFIFCQSINIEQASRIKIDDHRHTPPVPQKRRKENGYSIHRNNFSLFFPFGFSHFPLVLFSCCSRYFPNLGFENFPWYFCAIVLYCVGCDGILGFGWWYVFILGIGCLEWIKMGQIIVYCDME